MNIFKKKISNVINSTLIQPDTIFDYNGIKLSLPVYLLTDRIKDAFAKKYYEKEEADGLSYFIQENEIVMDIGCGIGYISILIAKNSNVSKIYSIEANPLVADVARRNFILNNVDITLYNEMLAEEDGLSDFYLHDDFWASSNIPWDSAKKISIPKKSFQKRLDEIQPTLLVVDIEGGEEFLFENVKMPSVRKIYMELHQNNIGRKGVKKVFDTLSKLDFHYDQWHSSREIVSFSHIGR